MKCKPAQSMLLLVLVLALLAALAAVADRFWLLATGKLSVYVAVTGLLILLLVSLDLLWSRRPPKVQFERRHGGSLPLGQWERVCLCVRHDLSQMHEIELYDHHPAETVAEGLPAMMTLIPGQTSQLCYRLRPLVRGAAHFSGIELRIKSRLGFWELQHFIPCETSARIYPNFSAVVRYGLLARDNHTSQIGIRQRPRRGEGTEFHQLREYRTDDSSRQIDWKATSRRLQLISREYQDERDQQVVLMLDSGRRMRNQDDELSHFDHALNACLLLAHVALRQGDSVAMMSFGPDNRWMSSVKGAGNIHRMLNRFYDLYPGNHASDFPRAARELMQHQRKRSLVVLVTNLRDEDCEDLLLCVRLLRQRHLVLVANLREQVLERQRSETVQDLDSALRYSGTMVYLEQRRKMQERLQAEGVQVADVTPAELSVQMINRYLVIKRTALL